MRTGTSAVLLSVIAAAAAAQNSRGSLAGAVQDANSGRVRSATVIIRAAGGALERRTTSDARGEFRIEDLPPGPYEVSVSAPGFARTPARRLRSRSALPARSR